MTQSETTAASDGDRVMQHFVMTATYQSPTNEPFTHTHTHTLSAPTSDKTSEKSTYLNALRKATIEMQEEINKNLTARMEEDKARQGGAAKEKVDEAKEEDNYGEEVVEED
jgi:hypothetical protein